MSTHYLLHLLLYNLNFDEPISKESSLYFFFGRRGSEVLFGKLSNESALFHLLWCKRSLTVFICLPNTIFVINSLVHPMEEVCDHLLSLIIKTIFGNIIIY